MVRVAATMLRYRIAALLLPFMLLAPALHERLNGFRWTYVAAVLALFASYVVATCLNDVFDVDIDRINHPGAKDRPLVSGDATRGQLLFLAAGFAVVALVASATIGAAATTIVVVSMLLNVAYSVPPLRLCARAIPAPLVLGIAYVAVPYGLGLSAAGVAADLRDARVVACFVILFVGRMLLKDFRDRRGDAAFGKRTFLLTYGKRSTLLAVLICVLAGDALLLSALPQNAVLVALVETYFAAIVLQLYRLSHVSDVDDERTAIALGARMGNAVVLTWLGVALLEGAGASGMEQSMFALLLAAMFWSVFAYLSLKSELPAAVNANVYAPPPRGHADADDPEEGRCAQKDPLRAAGEGRGDGSVTAEVGEFGRVGRVGRGQVEGGDEQAGPDAALEPAAHAQQAEAGDRREEPQVLAEWRVAQAELADHRPGGEQKAGRGDIPA